MGMTIKVTTSGPYRPTLDWEFSGEDAITEAMAEIRKHLGRTAIYGWKGESTVEITTSRED